MKPTKTFLLFLTIVLCINLSFAQEKAELPPVGDTIYSLVKSKGVDAPLLIMIK